MPVRSATSIPAQPTTNWSPTPPPRAGIVLFSLALAVAFMLMDFGPGATAKTPGKTYCFHGTCHRVLTLTETRARLGRRTSLIASFYNHCKTDRYNPCGLTASGAVFRPAHADNAASPIYPNGTKLMVWNAATKRAAIVRIDNAGPYWGNRTLDLSAAAARKLGFRHRGVARLTVTVLYAPTRSEATYRRRRVYPPVAGYIGRFDSLANALSASSSPSAEPGTTSPASVALVTLPVQNTFVAAHLARKSEQDAARRIAFAALTQASSVTLPVQLLRADRARLRRPKPARIAALRAPPKKTQPHARLNRDRIIRRVDVAARNPDSPSSRSKRRVRIAALIKTSTTARNRKPSTGAASSRSIEKKVPAKEPRSPVRPNRPNDDRVRKPEPNSPTQARTAKADDHRTIPATDAGEAPTPLAQPRLAWRQKYFGMNRGGT